MDINLTYRGPLQGSDDRQTRIRMKDDLRHHFNLQLWQLADSEPRLRDEFEAAEFATLRGSRVVPKGNPPPEASLVVAVKERHFLPIVDRRRSLICHLDITLLSRDTPGAIVHGGDLDNRLKTLLDALRIPHGEGEVPPPRADVRYSPTTLCLLEDDALITRLKIITDRLLEPPTETEKRGHVDLRVVASIRATGGSTHWLGQP